jgi:hypothetical protein
VIDPIPMTESSILNWQTSTGVTLVPASGPIRYEFHEPNEIILYLPNFSFSQNINPNPYLIEAFLPVEIRPSITYTQPILIQTPGPTQAMAKMEIGSTQIQIARGLDSSTDFFLANTTYTILAQSYRYLLNP